MKTLFRDTPRSKTRESCEEILSHLTDEGFTNHVSYFSLVEAITLIRGGDPRTIRTWIKNLRILGFIEPAEPRGFKLNLAKAPDAPKKNNECSGSK